MIRSHLRRYPRMQIADAWKLIQHARGGAAHAAGTAATTLNALRQEADSLGPGPPEPTLDRLGDIRARFCRIHLRPFLVAGRTIEELSAAFHEGTQHEGPADWIDQAAEDFTALARQGALPWPLDACRKYLEGQGNQGYPPAAHSVVFRNCYRPAYRVLPVDTARRVIGIPE